MIIKYCKIHVSSGPATSRAAKPPTARTVYAAI